ncbi:hypothetical protein D3C75_1138630 [compost metagenome]
MWALSSDHGSDRFRLVQGISAGFITSDPFTRSLTNVMVTDRQRPRSGVLGLRFQLCDPGLAEVGDEVAQRAGSGHQPFQVLSRSVVLVAVAGFDIGAL